MIKKVEVKNDSGVHARPASMIVKIASEAKFEVSFIKNGTKYNGKSIMSILSMGLKKGDVIEITTDESEISVLNKIEEAFNNGFGEL